MTHHYYIVTYIVYDNSNLSSHGTSFLSQNKVLSRDEIKEAVKKNTLKNANAVITIEQSKEVSKELFLLRGGIDSEKSVAYNRP